MAVGICFYDGHKFTAFWSVADSQKMEDILFTKLQISAFFKTIEQLKEQGLNPGKLHLQSSYGVLNYPDLPLDYARFGIAMYGCYSTPDIGKPAVSIQ